MSPTTACHKPTPRHGISQNELREKDDPRFEDRVGKHLHMARKASKQREPSSESARAAIIFENSTFETRVRSPNDGTKDRAAGPVRRHVRQERRARQAFATKGVRPRFRVPPPSSLRTNLESIHLSGHALEGWSRGALTTYLRDYPHGRRGRFATNSNVRPPFLAPTSPLDGASGATTVELVAPPEGGGRRAFPRQLCHFRSWCSGRSDEVYGPLHHSQVS